MLLSLRKGELISIKFYQGREGKVLCRKKKKNQFSQTHSQIPSHTWAYNLRNCNAIACVEPTSMPAQLDVLVGNY